MRFPPCLPLLLLLLPFQLATAFDYGFKTEDFEGDEPVLTLTDLETEIKDISTIFNDVATGVTVINLEWTEEFVDSDVIEWTTAVDGTIQASGSFNLTDVGRVLPTKLKAGNFTVGSRGRHEIVVDMVLGNSTLTVSAEYESYAAGVSIIPLLVVLIMAASTRMVRSRVVC